MASLLLLEDFEIQMSPCSTQWLQSSSCWKTSPNHHHGLHHNADSWCEAFLLICRVWFLPEMVLCIMAKHLHTGLVCPEDIVPLVLGFFLIQLYKPKLCYRVLLLAIFPSKPYLFSLFLTVPSWTLQFSVSMLNGRLLKFIWWTARGCYFPS